MFINCPLTLSKVVHKRYHKQFDVAIENIENICYENQLVFISVLISR